MNSDLQVLSPSDFKILRKWHEGTYHSPVKIANIEGKGKGVVACMDIKKSEFICEYSGDIIPISFKLNELQKNYVFQLAYGPSSKEDFVICPLKSWSLGNILNHSKEESANVVSYRVLTSEGVVILLIAKKAIKKG